MIFHLLTNNCILQLFMFTDNSIDYQQDKFLVLQQLPATATTNSCSLTSFFLFFSLVE